MTHTPKAGNPAIQATPSKQERTIGGATTIGNVMRELWERIDREKLTKDELSWFSGASEEAIAVLNDLKNTIYGLACMVGSEGYEGRSSISGSFQTVDSLPRLLFTIGNLLDATTGLMEISDSADCLLIYGKGQK